MEKIVILLVEDDLDDREILSSAIKEVYPSAYLMEITNGKELCQLADDSNAPHIDMIFMDINLPFCNGKLCLEKLRQSARYASVPIMMMTTSSRGKDIDDTFESGATRYIVKPYSYIKILELMKGILANVKNFNSSIKDKNAYLWRYSV
ncbi:CheY chemotaxis protein or a CheY-like REC (receiver) domain [Filimonas lacunae]|uniref:CheY chemotaxis protein or a CheY-like REC (Receiver) domain n=1 Tax=Filimonas lacunae TaxID=477680 RepID=A0A173MN54_9BACT|nr:response regulator [Filimonas lacunae]BAV08917.1 two-component response regulator [Filimonas lacunae]SIS63979.1 CheY chemotaxis protein or a CheY-like REC (receiver) domain [Filimonas lacunae]